MSILFAQSTKLFMCFLLLEYHSLMYWVFDGIFRHVVHDQILETMINEGISEFDINQVFHFELANFHLPLQIGEIVQVATVNNHPAIQVPTHHINLPTFESVAQYTTALKNPQSFAPTDFQGSTLFKQWQHQRFMPTIDNLLWKVWLGSDSWSN